MVHLNSWESWRLYLWYMPILRDYWWIHSSPNERRFVLMKLKNPGKSTLFKHVSMPYGHYCYHLYVDALGLDGFHRTMMETYRGCHEDRRKICLYPMLMLVLFAALKTMIQYVLGSIVIPWLSGMVLMCVVILNQVSVVMWLNRVLLRGFAVPHQLLFEAWALLTSWQESSHPWHGMSKTHDALSKSLVSCIDEVKTNSRQLFEQDAGGVRYDIQCLNKVSVQYRQDMLHIWWGFAAIYYGLLVWMSVEWVKWIMMPLENLESLWT